MAELILDAWIYLEEETVQSEGKVKDTVLWMECFSIYAGTKYPQSAPSLMTYQGMIVHASRTYKGNC